MEKTRRTGKEGGFIVGLISSFWRKLPPATMAARSLPTSKKTMVSRTEVLKTPI
jgi:hypothetical protein